jgi:hypothetical protein
MNVPPVKDRLDGCVDGCALANRECKSGFQLCNVYQRDCGDSCRRAFPVPGQSLAPPPCPRCDERLHGCLAGCERYDPARTNLATCKATCLNQTTPGLPGGYDAKCRATPEMCGGQGLANYKKTRGTIFGPTRRQMSFAAKHNFFDSDYLRAFMR